MGIIIFKNILPISIWGLMDKIRRNTTEGRITLPIQMFLLEAEYLFKCR